MHCEIYENSGGNWSFYNGTGLYFSYIFSDVEQAERLLRAIYQPQNIYCIHIDYKSPLLIHDTMRRIADCFHNVFIATHLKKVGKVILTPWGRVTHIWVSKVDNH